jgi:hypothetical protein
MENCESNRLIPAIFYTYITFHEWLFTFRHEKVLEVCPDIHYSTYYAIYLGLCLPPAARRKEKEFKKI